MPDKDYSHRDVTDKLGLKPGLSVRVVGLAPGAARARELLARVRAKTGRRLAYNPPRSGSRAAAADVILYWPRGPEELTPRLTELRGAIAPAGGIWVITAKRDCTSASGMGYFNQDQLIPFGAAARLVDNKICSLSDCESAMRFVIRKRDREK